MILLINCQLSLTPVILLPLCPASLTHKNPHRLSDLSTSNVWPNRKAIVQLANQVVGKFKNAVSIIQQF